MKKYVLIIALLVCLTGCSNIKSYSYDDIISKTLSEKKVKTNTYLEGYKLYLPEHMTLIGDLNNNDILYSYGDKYYLYVDLISYYNKTEASYDLVSNSKYSKEFDHKGLKGYVLVRNSKGGYLVEVMYNYAKIEVITNDVKRAIADSLIVLKNIRYNYKIIDSMIGSNAIVYDSKSFKLLGPEKKTDNFLQYVEEYGNYDEKENKNDEDIIDMEPEN